jgi:hypothetical protein
MVSLRLAVARRARAAPYPSDRWRDSRGASSRRGRSAHPAARCGWRAVRRKRGMGQRLLLAKCRPSERKLKTGAPSGRAGGKAKVIGTSSTWLGLASPARIVDADVIGLREVELTLMARVREIQSLHHFPILGPPDVLLVVVAHVSLVRTLPATFAIVRWTIVGLI